MKLDTPKDYVKYFHEMVSHIEDTIESKHKFKKQEEVPILLEIIDTLEKEMISYDSKRVSFSKFIHEVKKDTSTKGFLGWFSKDSKVKTIHELNDLFKKIMTAIKNIIIEKKLPDRFESKLKKNGKEFILSEVLSINILNLLINFKTTDTFDTLTFIEEIYPELVKHISVIKIDILNNTRQKSDNTRKNKQKNKSNNSRKKSTNTRKKSNNTQKNKQESTNVYPYGAKEVS
jgi:hypothetical protein